MILANKKFEWVDGKKGEGNNSWKYEFNQIRNKNIYAMSEQEQLQNAVDVLQEISNKYAPMRKWNPFLE